MFSCVLWIYINVWFIARLHQTILTCTCAHEVHCFIVKQQLQPNTYFLLHPLRWPVRGCSTIVHLVFVCVCCRRTNAEMIADDVWSSELSCVYVLRSETGRRRCSVLWPQRLKTLSQVRYYCALWQAYESSMTTTVYDGLQRVTILLCGTKNTRMLIIRYSLAFRICLAIM